jgi:hypothetical protein
VQVAGLALIQGVVDRIEHHADHGVGSGDHLTDRGGERPARLGDEVCFVEQG